MGSEEPYSSSEPFQSVVVSLGKRRKIFKLTGNFFVCFFDYEFFEVGNNR